MEEELQKLMDIMKKKNFSLANVVDLVSKQKARKVIEIYNEILFFVDYEKTLEQIMADGGYYWKNINITSENFPTPGAVIEKKKEIIGKMFHFNKKTSKQAVVAKMDLAGYRPSWLIELLFFGTVTSGQQNRLSIVALDSVWHGSEHGLNYVSYIKGGCRRRLQLESFESDFSDKYYFLGIKK